MIVTYLLFFFSSALSNYRIGLWDNYLHFFYFRAMPGAWPRALSEYKYPRFWIRQTLRFYNRSWLRSRVRSGSLVLFSVWIIFVLSLLDLPRFPPGLLSMSLLTKVLFMVVCMRQLISFGHDASPSARCNLFAEVPKPCSVNLSKC